MSFQTLKNKIAARTAKVGVIGLGYVGLPLAVEFAKAGFTVTGFDLDLKKIEAINSGISYIPDVPTGDVAELQKAGKLTAMEGFSGLKEMDTVTICVPTPLKKTKDPDISYIVSACEQVAEYLHPDMLVTLESTTYPGTTEELVIPMLTKEHSMRDPGDHWFWTPVVGKDLFVCFSPERVDPGNERFLTRNIPKVVGGCTDACTELGKDFYACAVDTVVPVKGTVTAEMVKLLENTFRMINIGLVNELALMCDRMGINIWDVIDAAKTKPFGFMAFYPGPGLGGHCIPIDPFYLSWKSKQYGCDPRFIELAGVINGQMPHYVVQKVQDALNRHRKALNGSHVHILGMAYKRDIDDVRESPALDIAHLLIQKGAQITYTDPFIPVVNLDGIRYVSRDGNDSTLSLLGADCVVIATDHTTTDYGQVVKDSKLIVDSRNALKNFTDSKIVRL
jgi:UDP-N-acetyl-D-glucosamine dehydrogenase